MRILPPKKRDQPSTQVSIESNGHGELFSVHRYVQRDLEDQIAEEKQILSKKPIDMAQTNRETRISQVIELLNKGYTRYKKDPRNTVGSIEEHFGIKPAEVGRLFKNPALKGKKVKSVGIKLVDDTVTVTDTTPEITATEVAENNDELFS